MCGHSFVSRPFKGPVWALGQSEVGFGAEVEKEIPVWEVIVQRSLDVLHRTAAQGRSKPFRNLITDRDGTTNNYCDRYASSVQSAYNAAWLSNFSRHCVDNAVFITAAPLGGRPSAEGLMELCHWAQAPCFGMGSFMQLILNLELV